jgi:hypothetical protein
MRSFLSIAALTLVVAGRVSADVATPTFNKDVAPILFQNCSSCHRPDEVGPFSLLTYEDARKRAKQIARVTEKKVMPPWKPTMGHEVFKNARNLTTEQIAVLKKWAEGGAPEGAARDLPPQPNYPKGWHLGPPDLIVKVSKPFTIPAEGPDIYVHFVLPLDFKDEKYIKACQVLPSNRRVAHHGVPILDGSGTARKLAKKHGGDHYPNFGGPGFIPRGFLPGYAPGQVTRIDETDDRGFTIGKGIDIVLQMHYHPTGKEETDQPQIGLYFTDKKPKRNPNIIAMANNDVHIPAGEKEFKRTDTYKLPVDFEVRDIWAHMHMIGRDVKVWAELPDGKKKDLLHIPDWDFNWQDTYFYKKPFVLPKGTVVKAEFTWDNTADNPRNPNNPPKLITWGEGSTDEMSGLIIGGVTVNPWDELGMWASVIGHYFEIEGKANEAKRRRDADLRRN